MYLSNCNLKSEVVKWSKYSISSLIVHLPGPNPLINSPPDIHDPFLHVDVNNVCGHVNHLQVKTTCYMYTSAS